MSPSHQFDAIVVGSGMTGGWAAKELTEKGLKVLVLERGRNIEHGKDYIGEHKPPWQRPFGGRKPRELYARDYPVQRTCYAFSEMTRHFWNNDRENPYSVAEGSAFHWVRTNVVGGRSIVWGRQVYRWSELDFEANKRDGHGNDWPIRYRDIEPWYRYVEQFIGVSGQAENLPQLPDGEFLPPMQLNVVEEIVKKRLAEHYPNRVLTIGRCAILTRAHQGRGACHYCGPCERGCSVGAYFCSLSSTLPAANATGNLVLRADSVVEGLDYDQRLKRITAVRVIDANTGARSIYTARVVFLCASTAGSLQILLNSRSAAWPEGLANGSGTLGKYLMDHHCGAVSGVIPGHLDRYFFGQRPNGCYLPRFRNLNGQDRDADFVRGYGFQCGADRRGWREQAARLPGFGTQFKRAMRQPGAWTFGFDGYGECLPYRDNRLDLHPTRVDRYGIPLVRFNFSFRDNEQRQLDDLLAQGTAMLRAVGATEITIAPEGRTGGDAVHEMGGARMGSDPRESVLNAHNQAHEVPNLYVTDGACMASSSCVNPSITYMALTARAANHAVEQLRDGNL